ncbi:hypothetical protein [Burkholderia sp. SRS-W-2-2016]|uniref:hypothetical protein n=1 Tax=Burkholderia sp. SRS-W-2-2016 TaxID=1926878 RepID=UPI00117C2766|nr:hypothetical protein [Burkholderia sp. SRS-W-2-2016]
MMSIDVASSQHRIHFALAFDRDFAAKKTASHPAGADRAAFWCMDSNGFAALMTITAWSRSGVLLRLGPARNSYR